jgi:hypothetical protein
MSDTPNDLRITIDEKGMAWLFLVLGLGGLVAAVVLGLRGDEVPWYGPLIAAGVGLAFVAVTFLLRDHAEFLFDARAGELTWSRQSWLGTLRKEGRESLRDIKQARVIGSAGGGGDSATWRCVIDLDPGLIPLTRAEDNDESAHQQRAQRINAWLEAYRAGLSA